MASLGSKAKKPLDELLEELMKQLAKTSQTAGDLASPKKQAPAQVAPPPSPTQQQNMNAQASAKTQNAAATTNAQNVTASAVVQSEDETADADIAAGNVKAADESVNLSPSADTGVPPSVADVLKGDNDSGEDAFANYQAVVDGTEKAQTSQETPAPDQELGSSGPSGPSFPGQFE